MSRLQGSGKAYYGKADKRNDGSYITTEWFVILLLPIYPIKSLRVLKLGRETVHNYIVARSESIRYQIIETLQTKNINQIIKTVLFSYGVVALLFGSLFLSSLNVNFIWLFLVALSGLMIFALFKSE